MNFRKSINKNLGEITVELSEADLDLIACMDERPSDIRTDLENPVNMIGASEGLADSVKVTINCSEEEAWKRIIDAGIPIMGHGDAEHGESGCAYRRIIATNHVLFGAREAVSVADRWARLRRKDTYYGPHNGKIGLINYMEGYSVDQDLRGFYTYDYWAAVHFARLMGIDERKVANYLLNAFNKALPILGVQTVFEIK